MTLPETFVDIRLSHLLRDCSVGAIVRHDQALMVVQDTRYWDGPRTRPHERELRYVDLVRRGLGLGDTKLCRPPVKEQEGDRIRDWVPARRFPGWTRCSRCGLLHHEPWKRGGIADPEVDEAAGARRTPTATKSLRCGQGGRAQPGAFALRRPPRAGALGAGARGRLSGGRALARDRSLQLQARRIN